MSRQTLEHVRNSLQALNEGDVDRYVSHCTRDVRLESPVAAVEGAYEGRRGIRRLFGDVRDAIPDFRLEIERLDSAGPDRVVALLHGSASGRVSGAPLDFALANLYELAEGKISRVRVFVDRDEAKAAANAR
jgi:ketosteroid isomerase-like protein